jgi:hypothetical protein
MTRKQKEGQARLATASQPVLNQPKRTKVTVEPSINDNAEVLMRKVVTADAVRDGISCCSIDDLTPDRFWRDFVSQRRPVRILGHLKDSHWNGSKWSNAYLNKKTVRV